MKKSLVFLALLAAFTTPAIAQQVAGLPICAAPGSLPFPAGPSAATVVDVDYANAAVVFAQAVDQFLTVHQIRPVAPGERVAFKGEYLDATKMIATVNGKTVTLTQAWGNPIELGARTKVTASIPIDAKPDANGNINVAVLGSNGPQTCRGASSPFNIKMATATDAVYDFPLDTEHSLMSGFVRIFNADGSTEITVDGQVVESTMLDTEVVAQIPARHRGLALAEVRQNGSVVATFQVSPSPTTSIARTTR